MFAINVVRYRIKPGSEAEFLDAHRDIETQWPGLRRAIIVEVADGQYSLLAEWESMEALAFARPQMIATLDSLRDALDDLEIGLGVFEAFSGPVLQTMGPQSID